MGMSLYPQSTPNMFHETNTCHASRPSANQPSVSHFVTHVLPQNLPSRFSQLQQQSTNRFQFDHDHSLVSRGQTATSGCSSTGPTHATARGAFTSNMSWGKFSINICVESPCVLAGVFFFIFGTFIAFWF